MTAADEDIAQQLLQEYRRAGGHGETIGKIPNHEQTDRTIPVLAEWLANLESRWPGAETDERGLARVSLIQALGRRQSRKSQAIPALLSQYDHDKTMLEFTRWTAGNSLYDIPADDQYFDQLVAVATDPAFGMSRQMVVNWLGRSKRREEATAAALSQLAYDEVAGHALDALAKLKATGIRAQVEPFADSKIAWRRRTARKILSRLSEGQG